MTRTDKRNLEGAEMNVKADLNLERTSEEARQAASWILHLKRQSGRPAATRADKKYSEGVKANLDLERAFDVA
jgi:hypothetical protein